MTVVVMQAAGVNPKMQPRGVLRPTGRLSQNWRAVSADVIRPRRAVFRV